MANENFEYRNSDTELIVGNLDKDGDIPFEVENSAGDINLIYLPRSKAIELRDWLSKVLEEEK